MTYYFSVVNGYLECTNSRKTIISDYVNFHTAHFTLDSSWVGYSKTATFINQKSGVSTNVVLGVESTDCIIPWESIEATVDGGCFIVGLSGYKDTKVIRTRMTTPILIEKSDVNDGDNPIPPTPDEYEQIMDLISSMGGTYTLPTASSTTLGGIKIGTHLNIDGSGVANVNRVSTTIDGVMSSTDKIKLDGIDDNANDYSLPTASNSILGGIKIGTNLSIDGNGVVSSQDTTYNVATQTENGLMSSTDKTKLDGLSNYTLPTATTSVLGGVKIDDSTIKIDGNGVISSPSEINDLTLSDDTTYSSNKIESVYGHKEAVIKLYGTKATGTNITLTDNPPTINATNYIETIATNNITIDWVNGLNMTFTRTSTSPVELKRGDVVEFNIYTAFNRDCSVEFGAISYINGVPVSSQQAFGNQDFSGASGFTTVQVLKYELELDLLPIEQTLYPIGTVFTTKLFKRQESASPTLTTRYLYGVNTNGLDRNSYAKIKTNI